MRGLLLLICFLMLPGMAFGQVPIDQAPGFELKRGFSTVGIENAADFDENAWSDWIVEQLRLDRKKCREHYTRAGKRVDILTPVEACEVEWVAKWYQAIGQSTLYSLQTNRPAAIVLLSRDTEWERTEIGFCESVCARHGIRLYVQIVPAISAPDPRPPKAKPIAPAPGRPGETLIASLRERPIHRRSKRDPAELVQVRV